MPAFAGGIDAAAENLAAHIDEIVRCPFLFQHAGYLVHRVAFGDGVETYLCLGILLDESSFAYGYLLVTDVPQQRIHVHLGRLSAVDETVGVHEGLYGDVVLAAGEFADTAGELDVADDVFVERIGLVAVDAAEQRAGVEYRHGAVGRSAYPFYLLPQTVRRLVRYRYLVDGAEGKSLDGFCRSGGPSAGCEQNGGPTASAFLLPMLFRCRLRPCPDVSLVCMVSVRFLRSVRCVGGGLTPLFSGSRGCRFRRA